MHSLTDNEKTDNEKTNANELATEEIIAKALAAGFSQAAVMNAAELVYVPEYRKYCEENVCGNYNKLPVCPPACGTVEEMHASMLPYSKALVLQTELVPLKKEKAEYLAGKRKHNQLMDLLLPELHLQDCLVMSAGPWKNYSCMSAYSIDAAKMAESCHSHQKFSIGLAGAFLFG